MSAAVNAGLLQHLLERWLGRLPRRIALQQSCTGPGVLVSLAFYHTAEPFQNSCSVFTIGDKLHLNYCGKLTILDLSDPQLIQQLEDKLVSFRLLVP